MEQANKVEANLGPGRDGTKNQSKATNKARKIAAPAGKSQLSSFILFASLIIMINLCPFQTDHQDQTLSTGGQNLPRSSGLLQHKQHYDTSSSSLTYLRSSFEFVKLMFSQPLRLNKRVTRFTQAEARVLGKVAKVWYIKKKIKKLSKKLKKHTIAVPVFTAIPIYEHSYYPQPHVTHVSHGMHHAAASNYAPATVAQMTSAASSTVPVATSSGQQQQMATSASNHHQVAAAYRMPPHRSYGGGAMYQPSASAHHIINAYAPSPPLFVDDTGGLYGHYGNAYGRYDGGYHVW